MRAIANRRGECGGRGGGGLPRSAGGAKQEPSRQLAGTGAGRLPEAGRLPRQSTYCLLYAPAVGAGHRIARARAALGWRPTDHCAFGRTPRGRGAQATVTASRRLLTDAQYRSSRQPPDSFPRPDA